MFPHSGCYNHGCEAIIRSSVDMLQSIDDAISIYTTDIENDKRWGLDRLCELIPNTSASVKVSTFRQKLFALQEKFTGKSRDVYELEYRNRNFTKNSSTTVALSVGGDNYCYKGMQHVLSEQMKVLDSKKVPCVLWGCSIEEEYLNEKVKEELNKYKIISSRESFTTELLQRIITKETEIVECSDPAFTLDRQAVSWHDDIMQTNNVIGINVSDLMKHYNAYPQATLNNFYRLIEYLLKETDSYIALIPHVRQKDNDDLLPILDIAKAFNNERILVLSEEYNCMQLKDVIARCRMFIGCRTHSTIAAYSTCVPTLVVGYSIKAKGIAKDIFGDYQDHIIDVREFDTDYDLTKKVKSFMEREQEIRKHLQTVMPEYIKKAYIAKDAVEKLIKNR